MKSPVDSAQLAVRLSFRRCEVRELERQLRVAGVLQDLLARTCDLRLPLLQGRDQLLSKRDLISSWLPVSLHWQGPGTGGASACESKAGTSGIQDQGDSCRGSIETDCRCARQRGSNSVRK